MKKISLERLKNIRTGEKICLLIEVFLLLLAFMDLAGHHREYTVPIPSVSSASVEEYPEGIKLETDAFALPRGSYRVDLHYTTDTDYENGCHITSERFGQRYVITTG